MRLNLNKAIIYLLFSLFIRTFSSAEAGPLVTINELHYHPNSPGEFEEFIEILNAGDQVVDISLWRFTDGIRYSFPPGTTLEPGGFLVIARDSAALEKATGFKGALGPWSGRLDNAGERLELSDNLGNMKDALVYADGGEWPANADGKGPSIELISPFLPNEYGESWRASNGNFGTPGARNSTFEDDPAPIITRIRHEPPVPSPGEQVTVTAIVLDNAGAPKSVTLKYRKDGVPTYLECPMYDDGIHGDGEKGDHIYGAILPGLGDKERLEFHIFAKDVSGKTTIAPSGAPEKTFLCQFASSSSQPDLPTYRIIMTRDNRQKLETRDLYSNDLLDATFIGSEGKIHYNVGLRYRGSNSRKRPQKSFRVKFQKDNPLDDDGTVALNLLALSPAQQWLGYDLFRRVGVPASRTKHIRVFFNESNLEAYTQVERIDKDFLKRVFPDASSGNLYRGEKKGDFSFRGESVDAYRNDYSKRTNVNDDWSDLIRLCQVLSNTPDEEYEAKVRKNMDVTNWLRFMAAHILLNNWEGGIYNFSGDDYYLYFKPPDGKALLIPWDLDTHLMGTQLSVWVTNVPSTKRFLRHPVFCPLFLAELRSIMDNEFSIETMNRQIEHLPDAAVSPLVKETLKKMVEERHVAINGEVSGALTLDRIENHSLFQAIPQKSVWRYFKGAQEPSGGTTEWTSPGFDDSSWTTGTAIFGYGDVDDTTDFPEMRYKYLSVYIRTEFDILDPKDIQKDTALLKVDFNDGYIAYINGREVARANMGPPGKFMPFNAPATDPNRVGIYEKKNLGSLTPLLIRGRNILAIQAHNAEISDYTFSIDACLELMDLHAARGRTWTLSDENPMLLFRGAANQWKTYKVEFNGLPASYSSFTGIWSYTHTLVQGPNKILIRALGETGEEIESLSQTIIWDKSLQPEGGTLARDTFWSAGKGPIHVQSTVHVPEGIILTVKEGAEIRFAPQTGIKVRGSLYLLGSPEKKIRLLPENGAESWGGISVEGESAGLIVKNAEARGGKFSLTKKSWGYIENLFLKDLPKETGIYAKDASFLMVKGSRLENVSTPVHAVRTGLRIEDCILKDSVSEGALLELPEPGEAPVRYSSSTPNQPFAKIPSSLFLEKQGALAHDETWDADSGPYYIPDTFTIPKGALLTIEPGAVIFLNQGARISVNGGLKAEGSEQEPVLFTGWSLTQWGSIIIQNAENPVVFRHCRFSHSSRETTAISIKASSADIENSVFEHCSRCVEVDTGGALNFRNNFVVESTCESQCVHAFLGGAMIIESCAFYDCLDPVEFSGESSGKSLVRNSFFIGGPDDGIDCNDCSPLILGNIITGFSDKGISLGLESNPVVERNFIYNCGMGIGTKNKCRSSLFYNTIVNNQVGIYGQIKTPDPDQAPPLCIVDSCIVWGNKTPILLENGSVLQMTNTDIDVLPVPLGEGNMNKDPKFSNALAGDYRLGDGSPCIGSGKNKTDMGAFAFSEVSPEIPKPPLPPEASCIIKRCSFESEKGKGIVIRQGVRGIVSDCRLKGFGPSPIVTSPDALVKIISNRIE